MAQDIKFKRSSSNTPSSLAFGMPAIVDTNGVLNLYVGNASNNAFPFAFSPTGFPACYVATTANLNALYVNGASGVGATLTNLGTLAAFSVDDISPSANARILVKNQTTNLQNGIYALTTVGSGAIAWVLTRVADYDSANEINLGAALFVQNGTAGAATQWIQTSVMTTMGTDSITFVQPSTSGLLLATNNLSDVASASTSRTNLGVSTTANIAASTNKNYVTDAQATVIGNTSGTNTGDQTITLTGNVTGSGTGSFAATIASSAVTYAKIQNVSATDKILGRATAGSGVVEEIACTAAARSILDDSSVGAIRTTLGVGTGDTPTFTQVSVASPSSDSNAATKLYTDNLIAAVPVKTWAYLASTANIANFTGIQPGDLIDGVAIPGNGIILLKDQSNGSQNGLFRINTNQSPQRTSDADTVAKLNGAMVFIQNGTVNYQKEFVQISELGSISDSQSWIQLAGNSLYTADGNGIEVANNIFNIELDGTTLSKSSSGLKINSSYASTFLQVANNLSDLNNASTARTNLGLGDSAVKNTGTTAGTVAAGDDSRITGALQSANNLSDVVSAATARSNLSAAKSGANTDINSLLVDNTGLGVKDLSGNYKLTIKPGSTLTADRIFTLVIPDAASTLTLTGSPSVSGSNTGDQTITLTGDVTGSGTGSFAATIASSAVTLAKMADIATASFLGRNTASTGVVEVLNATTATAMLNAMVGDSGSGGTKGLVPVPAAGDATKVLRGDATWVTAGTVSTISVVSQNGVSASIANATTTPALTFTLGAITPNSVEATSNITSLTGNVTGANLSGTNTGDQNIFSTIAVSGQSNVVADSTSDTLTLVAGSNITLTTDAGADSVTITASSSLINTTDTIVAKTNGSGSPYTIVDADSFKIFTNEGATAEVYLNLPSSPTIGQRFLGICVDSDNMRFVASSGKTIRLGSSVSASAGYCQLSGIGSTVAIEYVLSNQWILISQTGTVNIV